MFWLTLYKILSLLKVGVVASPDNQNLRIIISKHTVFCVYPHLYPHQSAALYFIRGFFRVYIRANPLLRLLKVKLREGYAMVRNI